MKLKPGQASSSTAPTTRQSDKCTPNDAAPRTNGLVWRHRRFARHLRFSFTVWKAAFQPKETRQNNRCIFAGASPLFLLLHPPFSTKECLLASLLPPPSPACVKRKGKGEVRGEDGAAKHAQLSVVATRKSFTSEMRKERLRPLLSLHARNENQLTEPSEKEEERERCVGDPKVEKRGGREREQEEGCLSPFPSTSS